MTVCTALGIARSPQVENLSAVHKLKRHQLNQEAELSRKLDTEGTAFRVSVSEKIARWLNQKLKFAKDEEDDNLRKLQASEVSTIVLGHFLLDASRFAPVSIA